MKSITVQHRGSKHTPVGSEVPLAGGATAFLRPGGGTFFSGSGFLGTTGTFKILFYFVSSFHRHRDNGHHDNVSYVNKYWEMGHFGFYTWRKKWQCLIRLGIAVPVAGGASSFLGVITFFSGTFFLTSGTLKTSFHDKNLLWGTKKREHRKSTEKDQHATVAQGRDLMQVRSPSVTI